MNPNVNKNTKLIFFDIDNTLWDNHMEIPASTKTALEKLKENGHLAFINTGRGRGNLNSTELLSLPFAGIVASCGNHVEMNGEMLYERLLPDDLVEKCMKLLKQLDIPTVYEGPGDHYVDEEGFGDDPYVNYLHRSMGEHLHPLEEYRPGLKFNKLSCEYHREEDYEAAKKELSDQLDFLRHPGTRIVEVMPKGSSKAAGIKFLCEYLNIPLENTYAIGDSVNDLEMIRYAAHGICMGNGTKILKEAADYITDDIHEDGLYKAMAYYGLIN